MGTGDADGVLVRLHDVAPGLGALKDGDASGAGSGDLGVVVVRGSRADEAVGALDILGAVADRDLDALGDQLVGGVALGGDDRDDRISLVVCIGDDLGNMAYTLHIGDRGSTKFLYN